MVTYVVTIVLFAVDLHLRLASSLCFICFSFRHADLDINQYLLVAMRCSPGAGYV